MPYIGKSPTGSGVRQRYHYTATGGETSLSGADDNSKTLKFTDGEYVDVYLNGVLLVQGTDYGVGTANTISSLAALAAGDIVEVIVYDIFNVAKINSEAVRTRHYFTASGGETSIGTSQIGGLSFAANEEIDVMLNGVSLVAGTDYNTSSANTVGGLSALTAGQVVEIVIYEKFQLADTVSKAAGGTFSGPVTFSGQTTFSGDVVGAVQEYFHVDLTTAQTGNSDNTTVVVDFGSKGTVKYDTKSNVDTSNDAYLLDSSDGVYLISFSVGIASATIGTEQLIDTSAFLEVATDGSTFAALQGSGSNVQDSNSDEAGAAVHSGTFIYKATTATTKIRVRAHSNTASSANYTIAHEVQSLIQATQSASQGSRCTFLSIVRIA